MLLGPLIIAYEVSETVVAYRTLLHAFLETIITYGTWLNLVLVLRTPLCVGKCVASINWSWPSMCGECINWSWPSMYIQ